MVHSGVVIEWFLDEDNPDKKFAAYNELMNALRVLYNNNLYVAIAESGREYILDINTAFENFGYHARVSRENPDDNWFFDLYDSPFEYRLNVDIDKEMLRKRVWLNYKVNMTA
jgi:hypothetical protein